MRHNKIIEEKIIFGIWITHFLLAQRFKTNCAEIFAIQKAEEKKSEQRQQKNGKEKKNCRKHLVFFFCHFAAMSYRFRSRADSQQMKLMIVYCSCVRHIYISLWVCARRGVTRNETKKSAHQNVNNVFIVSRFVSIVFSFFLSLSFHFFSSCDFGTFAHSTVFRQNKRRHQNLTTKTTFVSVIRSRTLSLRLCWTLCKRFYVPIEASAFIFMSTLIILTSPSNQRQHKTKSKMGKNVVQSEIDFVAAQVFFFPLRHRHHVKVTPKNQSENLQFFVCLALFWAFGSFAIFVVSRCPILLL